MRKGLRTYLITFLVLIAGVTSAGLISRLTTFTDGSVLFASDLNGEFNQLVNLVNGNLDDDNISASAAISPAKVGAAIAGDGISRNGSTGALAANVDDVGIEISSDTIQLKADGIPYSKLNEIAGLSVLATATASTGNVAALTASTDAYVLARSGSTLAFGQVQTAGIANNAVTSAKLAAANSGVSSSSGSFATGSATLVQVTNLSVTLTTTGRPVVLGLISADTSDLGGSPAAVNGLVQCSRTPAAEADCQLAFTDSATVLTEYSMRSGQLNGGAAADNTASACSSYLYFGIPSAGSHTFLLKVRRSSANTQAIVNGCKLFAYEL